MKLYLALILSFVSLSTSTLAASFPISSCKGWNATITSRAGTNTKNASMQGKITQPDLLEYCERDPGGETLQYGGRLSIEQCVQKYLRSNGSDRFKSSANCAIGKLTFSQSDGKSETITLPLQEGADTSCASGIPPLIQQFKILCPSAAEEMGLPD